ncbi:MAG: BON domain-containing protein [Deltaproteobacteria bacterium]
MKKHVLISGLLILSTAFPVLAQQQPSPGDRDIEKSVAAMIVNDPMLRRSRRDIKIKAENGVVWLDGTAESLFDKMQAGLYAEQTRGVKDVHNCLRVKSRWPWEDDACGRYCGDVFEDDRY